MIAGLDEELRERLFDEAPPQAMLWMGDVIEIGTERELVPLRFSGLDFWVIFASPHSEAGHDADLLALLIDNLDVKNFVPDEQSRLIKFCRCDAKERHFEHADWGLPDRAQIFQFLAVLRTILAMYLDAAPEVKQFFYLANERLQGLYSRMLKKLLADLDGKIVAILPEPGGCYAYRRA